MHHVHRILALAHVQPGKRAPGAPDRIERASGQALQHLHAGERVAHDPRRLLRRAFREVHQRQAPKRKRQARVGAAVLDVGQFERASAEIADNSVRRVDRADDAQSRELRFLLAAEQVDSTADGAFRQGEELRTVRGVAHRRGGQPPNIPDSHRVAEHAEPLQRRQRLGDRVLRQEAGRGDASPQAAERLLVERRRRRSRLQFVSDQADRVRADVHDRDRRPGQPALRNVVRHGRPQSMRGGPASTRSFIRRARAAPPGRTRSTPARARKGWGSSGKTCGR